MLVSLNKDLKSKDCLKIIECYAYMYSAVRQWLGNTWVFGNSEVVARGLDAQL